MTDRNDPGHGTPPPDDGRTPAGTGEDRGAPATGRPPAPDPSASDRPAAGHPAVGERPSLRDVPSAGRAPARDMPSAGGAAMVDLPFAGRRPRAVTGPIGRPLAAAAPATGTPPGDDEPTVVTPPATRDRAVDKSLGQETAVVRPAFGAPARPSEGPDDEATRRLTVPAASARDEGARPITGPAVEAGDEATRVIAVPAADDEPTVERSPRPTAEPPASAGHRDRATAEGAGERAAERATGDERIAPGPADEHAARRAGDDLGAVPRAERAEPSPAPSPERVTAVGDTRAAAASGDPQRVPESVSDLDETAGGAAAAGNAAPGGAESGDAGAGDAGAGDADVPAGNGPAAPERAAPWKRLSSAGALIWVLLALFGFTLVVQLRSNDGDQGLATARQEDLVRILSDLDARDSRLQSEITALESSQRQLTSGVSSRQAALEEAAKRADELGLLAGTLPGKGPGLRIVMDKVKASAILNAVEELRGSGGEVMEIAGADGTTVRIVASSYFVDAEGGGIVVDGARVTGPYTLWVIGSPQTMQPALQIPGGVVASVNSAGGSVTMEARAVVEVTAVRKATALQYARPVS
jgi:uncharacterized protein YlxW (UPF0749 family)